MKKFLAIILSVMMIISACGVASFAFYEEDLPAFPAQTEGQIIFAAENVYVEPGQTYDVPVYLVSNYKTDIQEGFAELGFSFYVSSNTQNAPVVNGVSFASAIQGVKDFYAIEAGYGYTQEQFDNFETFHAPSETTGYVAFAADISVLNQAKTQVATVSITVPEELDSEDAYVSLGFGIYNFNEAPIGYYFRDEADVEVYVGGIFEGTFTAEDMEACEERLPEITLAEGTIDGGDVFFSANLMVKFVTPPAPTWLDKLIDWVQFTIEGILQVFETVHSYIRTALPLLDKIEL